MCYLMCVRCEYNRHSRGKAEGCMYPILYLRIRINVLMITYMDGCDMILVLT